MLRRIGILASLAVVAAMFAGVQTASATTAGVCVFTGLSGTLTPAIQSIESDLQSLTPVDIERGNYDFHTGAPANAACAGVFNDIPTVEPNATILSKGSYDNILCGTGLAHDLNGDETFVRDSTGNEITGAGYEIPFVAGQGPLIIGPKGSRPSLASLTAPLGTDGPNSIAGGVGQDDYHQAVNSDFTGVGFVNIVPVNAAAGGCGSAPVSEFQVTGFFIAEDIL